MIKKLSSMLLLGVCGVLMTAHAFAAEENNPKEHTPIGKRSESIETRMEQLETRAKMAALELEKSKEKPKVTNKNIAKSMMASVAAKSLYYSSHPAAYQNPVSISYFGDNIELTDGSVWIIASSDAYKAVNWFSTDLVIITPNHSWFSSYPFCLTNQNTGESVAADLSLGPIDPSYGSFYTHWIVGIDYYYLIVYLEDGSIWNMSNLDSHIVNQWIPNDVVIIGVNDGWFSGSNPNVLINVAMLNFAAGAASF